jgi:hypothetical protein
MSYGTTNIKLVATLLLDSNTQRISTLIVNQGPSTVFIGPDDKITTANCISIASGSNLTEDSGGDRLYVGPYYAISVSESNLSYWQRTR